MERFVQRVRTSLRMDFQEFPEADPEVKKKADFAYRVVVILCVLLAILYIVFLIVAVVFSAGADPVSRLAFAAASPWIIALLFTSLVLGSIKSMVGIFGVITGNRKLSIGLLISSVFVTLLVVLVLTFAIFRGNGVPALDDASFTTFSTESQKGIIEFALAYPVDWKLIQDVRFGECCGLNMASTYADSFFGVANFDLDAFLSGINCASGRTEIDDLKAIYPVYNSTVEGEVANIPVLAGNIFFCEQKFLPRLRSFSVENAPWLTILIVAEVVMAIFLMRLLFRYTRRNGGMKANYEKYLGPTPKAEDTILKRAGYTPSPA